MRLATSAEIRTAEEIAWKKFGLSPAALMERAGSGAARVIAEKFPAARKVLVIAGPGRNGGDGKIIARRLNKLGKRCRLLATTRLPAGWKKELREADLLVDAIFGVGLSRPVRGIEREIIEAVNLARRAGRKVVAVDIPSGLCSDTGRPWGAAVLADLTCTMAIGKVGLHIGDGPSFAGEIQRIDIGIPEAAYEEAQVRGKLIEPSDFREILIPRRDDSHKGTFGHLLLVGGSVNRLGAPLLAAEAALRTGAGLVTLALPDRCYQKIPRGLLEVMYEPLPSNSAGGLERAAGPMLTSLAKGKDAVAAGPGLGVTREIRKIVEGLLGLGPPIVLDADALNVLAKRGEIVKKARGPVVLTPHPGEMGRLLGITAQAVQKDRLTVVREAARRCRAIVVLKGFRTLVATPNGSFFVNPTGNPGMATAGMGDVLTGMIGALIVRGSRRPLHGQSPMEPSPQRPFGAGSEDYILPAVLAAVYLHGLAGDRVSRRLGDRGLIASDLAAEIPLAFKELVR